MLKDKHLVRNKLKNKMLKESGVVMIEYALIIATVSLCALAGFQTLETAISDELQLVSEKIGTIAGSANGKPSR